MRRGRTLEPARLWLIMLAGSAAAVGGAAPAAAQSAADTRATITNVSASFRPGPYTSMSVDLADPGRVAVGTADGHLSITVDGGTTATESLAIAPRKMDPVTIRGGARAEFSLGGTAIDAELARNVAETGSRDGATSNRRGAGAGGGGSGNLPDERATKLFIRLLNAGLPAARYQAWMAMSDPVTEIGDVAFPRTDGPLVLAAQAGIHVSDASWRTWSRTLGGPGPMPHEGDLIGLSAAIDPTNSSHILVSTDRGVMVSSDGGYNFGPHPDADFEDAWVSRLVWDPANPQLVFAVTPDSILLSQDGGLTFDPSFAAEGEIKDLSLSADAAVVATAEGVQVATSEGVTTLADDKDFVGAVPWRGGSFLAATAESLYLLLPGGGVEIVLQTSSTDPFLEMGGDAHTAWLLSSRSVLRIGDPVPRGGRLGPVKPPRMLLSMSQLERAVIAHNGLGGPEDTRLHNRWYARMIPTVTAHASGTLGGSNYRQNDGVLFPLGARATQAAAWDRLEWAVIATWDLSEVLLGDSNVSDPNLVLEQQIRDKRTQVIEEVRWRYRECAALARDLSRPPRDPEAEVTWRLRLEEYASYLEFMSGRRVVHRSQLEHLTLE